MTDQQDILGAGAPGPGRPVEGEPGAEFGPDPAGSRLPALVMALVAVLVCADVLLDWDNGADLAHMAIEFAAVALAAGAAAWLWWRLQSARRHARHLALRLEEVHADAARLRADVARFRGESQQHARGLGEAIDRQFQRWGLSPAEREVALLLVKGLSHKEAAEVRATSERTVRQQALAVYRKAGLAGRAELAAFFLEDLLQPVGPQAAAPTREAPAPAAAGGQ